MLKRIQNRALLKSLQLRVGAATEREQFAAASDLDTLSCSASGSWAAQSSTLGTVLPVQVRGHYPGLGIYSRISCIKPSWESSCTRSPKAGPPTLPRWASHCTWASALLTSQAKPIQELSPSWGQLKLLPTTNGIATVWITVYFTVLLGLRPLARIPSARKNSLNKPF